MPEVLVGPGSGVQLTRLLSGADGTELASGYPLGATFAGGVRVASGDVNGDGIPDPITGAGPGSGYVRVFSGSDISVMTEGRPFGPDFAGGVYVAAGDVDNDGRADIIVGQGEGGGTVAVLRADTSLIASVTPFGAGYAGGVRVASGDVNGDGVADLLAAQATGGVVTIIDGATGAPIISAMPYGTIPGGVFVTAGDVTGDGVDDVIVSPGSGNAPVQLFDLRNGQALGSFTAYAPGFTAGVRVAAADLNGDHRADIITAPGPGSQPLVRVFDGVTLAPITELFVYEPAFAGGVFVASIDVPRPPTFTSAAATTFQAGEPNTFTVTTTGRPAITTVTSSGSLPGGVTFTDQGDGTAVLAGTPALGSGGSFPLTLTATNRAGVSVVQDFSLTVESLCQLTIAPTDLPAAFVGEPWSIQFTQSGTAAPVTWSSSGSLPAGLILTPATGVLSGTPEPGAAGSYAFTVSAAAEDGCSGGAAVTLSVGVNDAPTVASATIAYDTAGNTQLHAGGASRPGVTARIDGAGILAKSGAADADGPAPLSVVPQTDLATPHGVVTIAADGSFSYVPAAGFTGLDSFAARVTDSRLSAEVTVNVTVASRVWYVNNRVDGNNAAGGDGRSTDAFETLAAASAASAENDIIFVFVGDTAATPLADGIDLKNGQQLIGEHVGLTIGAHTLVAPSAVRPAVAVDGIAVTVAASETRGDRTGVAIRGLDLRSGTATAVVLAGAGDGAALGLTVDGNRLRGQGLATEAGLSVQHASTAVATVSVHDNVVSDVAAGIGLTGSSGPLYVTALRDNVVTGILNTGIVVSNAIFDAVPGGSYDVVDGGITMIGDGDSAPSLVGVALFPASGALAFRELHTRVDAAGPQTLSSALLAIGTGTYTGTSGLALSIAGGSVASADTSGVLLIGLTADVHLASIDARRAPGGLGIQDVSGVVAVAGGVIEKAPVGDAGVVIRGGAADVTYGGSISGAGGSLVTISGTVGGTTLFTGPIDDGAQGTGGGVKIENRTGGTVTFAGGLRLSTADMTALDVQGGGTINVCATQACEPGGTPVVNTLATTSGAALTVRETTIGAHHLTFQSISAGASSSPAVTLAQTGASGGLRVTGTGTAGSGGTITGRNGALHLVETRDVSLNWMALRDYGVAAISGSGIHNFELRNSVVASTVATIPESSSLLFIQLTGQATIADTSISGGAQTNLQVSNVSGALDRLTLSNVTFGDNSPTLGVDGVELIASGSETTMNVTVENSTFTASRGRLFSFSVDGATADLVFAGNTLRNDHDPATRLTDRGHLLIESVGAPAPLTYAISGNTFRDSILSAITVRKAANEAVVGGSIRENIFGVTGVAGSGSSVGSAILLQSDGLGSLDAGVTGNTIRQYGESGVRVVASGDGGPSAGTVRLTLTGNSMSEPAAAAGSGLAIDAGGVAGDSFVVCASANTNDFGNGGGGSGVDLALRQNHQTTIGLLEYDGAATDAAAVRASLLGHGNTFDSDDIATSGSGGGFVNLSALPACAVPQP